MNYDLIPLVIMGNKKIRKCFCIAGWFTSPSSSSMIFFKTFLIDDLPTNLFFYSVSFSLKAILVYTN